MLTDTLKKRLAKDRPVTSITLRIPVDVVDSLKAIAPQKGFSGYQTLLKAYISEGLRRDEAVVASDAVERLAKALKKLGVSKKLLDDRQYVTRLAYCHIGPKQDLSKFRNCGVLNYVYFFDDPFLPTFVELP